MVWVGALAHRKFVQYARTAARYLCVIGAVRAMVCDRPPTTGDSAMSKNTDAAVLQPFGNLKTVRIGLAADVRSRSVRALNRLLAHSMAMRDLYKKAHWQTSGAVFYALHLMFDKHYEQQLELIDSLAERVQLLGAKRPSTATTAPTTSSSAK
jgi:hypothetical protein